MLVAHSAAFDRRVLAQAFERAGVEWPDPPVICTVALARRLHPLARQRKLAALAGSLGIEVETVHRALADAETCARVFCALFPRLVANAPTVGRALELLAPPRRARPRAGATDGGGAGRGARRRLPDLSGLHDSPGVYVVRNEAGRCSTSASRCGCARACARTSRRRRRRAGGPRAPRPSSTTARRPSSARCVLEQQLVGELRPPGNASSSRRRLVLAALPAGHRLPGARGRARAGARARGQHRAAARAGDGRRAVRAADLAVRPAPLRPAAAAARQHPSAFGQMGRCLSPCLGDLDPNLYRAPGRRRAGAVRAAATRAAPCSRTSTG